MLSKAQLYKPSKKHAINTRDPNKKNQSGNIFFTLFGAVAVVGLLGAAIMSTMRGPLSTMVEVQSRAQAESEMAIASRLSLLEATELADGGDCDGDGFVEALEYTDAGGAGPVGGGFLPNEVASSRIDPWGTEYGYCGWDPGAVTDAIACDLDGDTTNERLDGNGDPTDETYTVVAIVSAGPDQVFNTTCVGGASPAITKTGDDIIVEYTYATATADTGGLWNLKSNEPTTAEISKDLEVTGGASFTAGIDLTSSTAALQLGAASMLFPDETSLPTCNGANAGLVRLNKTFTPDRLEVCDEGGSWSSVAGGSIWLEGAGDDIYYDTGTFQVGIGTSTPSEALDVIGNIDLTGNLTAGGDLSGVAVTGTGNLTITGTSDLRGDVSDSLGDFTINDALVVTGTSDLQGDVSDSIGDFTINDNLVVTGTSEFQGAIDSQTSIRNTTGDVLINDALAVTGTSNFRGDISDSTGDLTFADDVVITGTTDAQGAISNSTGEVDINDDTDITGDLDVSGSVSAGTTVNVDGDQLGPAATCTSSQKLEWNNGSGWSCVTDLQGGSGGGVPALDDLTDVAAAAPSDNDCLTYDNGSGNWVNEPCSTKLNSITAADGTNVIANADFEQRWRWELTANAASGIVFGESAASTAGTNSQYIVAANTLLTSTAIPFKTGVSATGLKYGIKIDNENNTVGAATGIEFSTQDAGYGKGGLVYERTGGFGIGDFKFLQETTATDANTAPALADSVLTIKNDGDIIIGPDTAASLSLKLDVAGPVGATQYCDQDGLNCFTPGGIISSDIFEVIGGAGSEVVRQVAASAPLATSDFVFGSTQLDDDTTNDARIIFDKSLGAFRAGAVGSTQWDLASRGLGSAAFNIDNTANGTASFAANWLTTASGVGATAFGYGTQASGTGSFSMGLAAIAGSGTPNPAIGGGHGNATVAVGLQSGGIPSTLPVITGDRSMALFMDQNTADYVSGYDLTDSDMFAIVGGTFMIDSQPSTAASRGCIQFDDTTDKIQFSHDCSTYTDFGTSTAVALSDITAATATNNILNAGNSQTWQWQLSGAGRAMSFSESAASTGGVSAGQSIVSISTLATSTAVPLLISNLGAQYTLYALDEGGDTSPFIIDADGNVGIGTTATSTGGDQNLELDVEGDVGAINYCDEDGNYCFTAAGVNSSLVFEVTGGAGTELVRQVEASAPVATSDFLFGSAQLADAGNATEDARMFFDKSKGAFRAGAAQGTQWNNANVGDYSVALGLNNRASGSNSVAIGSSSTVASGAASIAIGQSLDATNTNSIAMGINNISSGINSMSIGLGDVGAMMFGTFPTVSGNNSLGVFTGHQVDVAVTGAHLFAFLGGNMIIDPTPAATVAGTSSGFQSLELDVEGDIGAVYYCDNNGNNCFTAASVAGGSVFEVTGGAGTELVRQVEASAPVATSDFLFGSAQLADAGNATEDARMFFDKSKGAFRAGTATLTQWDDASVGTASTALGYDTIASGIYSTAFGQNTQAAGLAATAFGKNAAVTGNYSVGFGLLNGSQTALPVVSGNRSIAFFMGLGPDAQSGVDVTAAQTFALLGGTMVIDPAEPATELAASTGGDQNLELDVEGDIGAINYCDEDGNNCFTAASVASGTALSDITAATATNSISNAAYQQDWRWQLTAPSYGLRILESAASTGGANNQFLMGITTLAGSTATPFVINNLGAGYSFVVTDEAVETTPFVIDVDGNVGIQEDVPLSTLHIGGSGSIASGITFGDGDSGFYEASDDVLNVALGGVGSSWVFETGRFYTPTGTGPTVVGAIDGLPQFIPNRNDTNTGFGRTGGDDTVAVFAGGNIVYETDTSGNMGLGDFTGGSDTIDSRLHLQTGEIRLDGGAANEAGCIQFDDTADELQYSDDCSTYVSFSDLSGSGGVFEVTGGAGTELVRQVAASAPLATSDFVFGSAQLADAGNATEDNRLFFDKSKGAVRAGSASFTQWNDANVGTYSIGIGTNVIASGYGSMALGYSDTADGGRIEASATGSIAIGGADGNILSSGYGSVALGGSTAGTPVDGTISAAGNGAIAMGFADGNQSLISSGTGSMVWGTPFGPNSIEATGDGSTAFGRDVSVTGDYSVGIGLGNATTTTEPVVSAEGSIGIFMGDQSGADVSSSNTMALLGGSLVIGSETTDVDGYAGIKNVAQDSANSDIRFYTYNNTAGTKTDIELLRARGTEDSPTIVQDGTVLGSMRWKAYDGVNFDIAGAINVVIDGTPGANDLPAEMNFWVANDGSIVADASSLADMTLSQGSDLELHRYTNTQIDSANLDFYRGHNSSSSPTIAVDGDLLGGLRFYGSDSNTTYAMTAKIEGEADGTVSAGNMPTALTFSTGLTNSPTERMRIAPGGYIGVGDFSADTIESALHIQEDVLRLDGGAGNEAGCIQFDDTADELQYSDDCSTYVSFSDLSGSGGVFEVTGGAGTELVRQVAASAPLATSDFVFGSTQLDDDTTNDARIIFDKSLGAFRAGEVQNAQWNLANRGQYSIGLGFNVISSGIGSFASGGGTTASGDYSTAMGGATTASGDYSFAFGRNSDATAQYSIVMGNQVDATANNTMGISLGNAAGTPPVVSGTRSLGVFINDQSGIDLSTTDTVAFVGGNNFIVGSYQLDDTTTGNEDARMYLNRTKGAFRAGSANGAQWDNANVGTGSIGLGTNASATLDGSVSIGTNTTSSAQFSFAIGTSSTASANFATALGASNTASAIGATAIGGLNTASGDYNVVLGYASTASSGTSNIAIGNEVKVTTADSYSMAIGLADQNNDDSMRPQVTAGSSLGIFLATADNYDLDDANTLAVLGGEIKIDSGLDTPASSGCIRFNDASDKLEFSHDCSAYSEIGSAGSSGMFERSGTVVRGNASTGYVASTDDFVFGSSQLDDTGTGSEDNRFFYDRGQGAFRAGAVQSTEWDNANLGAYSVAMGFNTQATGSRSVALGNESRATANYSIAMGDTAISNGGGSIAIGIDVTAGEDNSIAIGNDADVKSGGTNSMIIGLGNASGSAPSITATNALGIFMGDQSGSVIAYPNTMAVVGGDFVVGSTQLPDLASGTTGDNRMFFYTNKAAFRAGTVVGAEWDDVSVGAQSTAFGLNTTASAVGAMAWGGTTQATNAGTTAFGFTTLASGLYGTVWGDRSQATNTMATAWGQQNTASGIQSTAWGQLNTASGDQSTAWGIGNTASGIGSTAVGGGGSVASNVASVAIGTYLQSSGFVSTAIGNKARVGGLLPSDGLGNYSVAMGLGDTPGAATTYPSVTGASSFGIFMGDQANIDVSDSNTMAVVGGDFIVGSPQIDDTTTGSQDSRMYFDVSQSAFRAGEAGAAQWDPGNVGAHSAAFGSNTTASNDFSFAAGSNSVASGTGAVAIGVSNSVSGNFSAAIGGSNHSISNRFSFATGASNTISSQAGVAMGALNTVDGLYGIAMGNSNQALSQNSIAIGANNTASTGVFNIAIGNEVRAIGTGYSMAIGLSTQTNTDLSRPQVTGEGSLGVFMDDVPGYVLSAADVFSIIGGRVFIDYDNSGSGAAPSATAGLVVNGDIIVNGSTTTCTLGNGSGATNCTSDERLKENIETIDNVLAKIDDIHGVTFNWKDKKKPQDRYMGVIAQEIERVFPEVVDELSDGTKTVDYAALVAPLIQASKELKSRNNALSEKVDTLKQDNENIHEIVSELKDQVDLLNKVTGTKVGKASMSPYLMLLLGLLFGAMMTVIVVQRKTKS